MATSTALPAPAPNNATATPPTGGTSMSDMLTALKNLVTALNTASTNYLNVQGQITRAGITAPTVLKTTAGRCATVSVVKVGSTTGFIYDGATLGATTKPLWVIPMTLGATFVNMATSFGVLVVPGTGMEVSVVYS